jgi:hypothetical protein
LPSSVIPVVKNSIVLIFHLGRSPKLRKEVSEE